MALKQDNVVVVNSDDVEIARDPKACSRQWTLYRLHQRVHYLLAHHNSTKTRQQDFHEVRRNAYLPPLGLRTVSTYEYYENSGIGGPGYEDLYCLRLAEDRDRRNKSRGCNKDNNKSNCRFVYDVQDDYGSKK